MSGQEKSLNRKNGTLRGVEAQKYNPDTEEWELTKDFVGFVVGSDTFLIGHVEREDGYELEIELSEKALRNMLDAITDQRELLQSREDNEAQSFSEDPYSNKWDWLEGDFPT